MLVQYYYALVLVVKTLLILFIVLNGFMKTALADKKTQDSININNIVVL